MLYYLSQLIIILAYIILGIGFRKKERIKILKFSSIYQGMMVVSFMLLKGTMGIIASIISLMRNFLFIYNEKKRKSNPSWALVLFCILAVILTIVFYKKPVDIFPLIMTLIGIFSYWCTNTKITRLGNVTISACYIIYAISLRSWFSIICESYLIVNTLIGFFKHEVHNN